MELKVGDKVKFSDQSWNEHEYLIAGKEYEVVDITLGFDLFEIVCDGLNPRKIICRYPSCGHLNNNAWEKVEENITDQIGILIKSEL